MSIDPALWNEIDEAVAEKPPRRGELIDALLPRLRALASSNEPETLYALGYALYNHSARNETPTLQQETEAVLRRVLEGAPKHAWARLYLGYNAYDLGRYDEAREYFASADGVRLPANFALSRIELILACDLRTNGIAASLPAFERYVADAERLEPPDIFPMSLSRTLKDLHESIRALGPADFTELEELVTRLDRAAEGEWFLPIVRGAR